MLRSRLICLILMLGLLCGFSVYKWLPNLVSYDIAEKLILSIAPIPSALLLLFWRQYRGLDIYEKLNGRQAIRFNSLKPLIYKRIFFCFFISLGTAAIALCFNFIIKNYYQINPEYLPTIFLATTTTSLTVSLYLITTILYWVMELADFSDQLSEKAAKRKRIQETMSRLEPKESS